MDPEIFIPEEDVRGLLQALLRFAQKFITPRDRQNILTASGAYCHSMTGLDFNGAPLMFANELLAAFQSYSISDQRLDYHPMVSFLKHVLGAGREYGFNDQDIALCKALVEKGKKNFKELPARSVVRREPSSVPEKTVQAELTDLGNFDLDQFDACKRITRTPGLHGVAVAIARDSCQLFLVPTLQRGNA